MTKFEHMAEEISDKAAKVPCSREDYIEGLEAIRERLQLDIEAASEF